MNRNTFRRALLGSTTLGLALAAGSSAFAQDVLETVIVTAEKQAEDLQKTSVSITAVQPDEARTGGDVMLEDLLKDVATIDVHKGGGSANRAYFIRGIGSSTGSASVPVLYDGIADSTNLSSLAAGFDTSRVEVLRGPQGTLYGHGAFAGLVSIITNDPTDKYEGKIRVEGGSFNEVSSDAVVNIPLQEDMALRVAAGSYQRTGYAHPDGRGSDDFAVLRAKLLYHPTEDFSIKLLAGMTNSAGSGTTDTLPTTVAAQNFASPAFGGFNPCGGDPHPNKYDAWHSPPKYYAAYACTVPAQLPVNPSPVTGVCQTVARAENQFVHYGTDVEWNLGFANLTVLADNSLNGSSTGPHGSQPFLGTVPAQIRWNSYSPDKVVESRLTNDADSWIKWLFGLYWESQKGDSHSWQRPSVTGANGPIGVDRVNDSITTTKAVFGQFTVPVTDAFRVTGGYRYNVDENYQQSTTFNVGKRILTAAPSNTDFRYDQNSYKASLEYDIAKDNMVYAQLATGFRPGNTTTDRFCQGKTSGHLYLPGDGTGAVLAAGGGGGCATTAGATATSAGGLNGEGVTAIVTTSAIAPDSVKTYEIGSKNRFLDNKVQINVAAYYYSFAHLSGSLRTLAHDNTTNPTIQELTGTKAYGGELETTWLLTSNDRIDFNLAYEPTKAGVNAFMEPLCYNYGIASHPQITTSTAGVINTVNFAACAAKNLAANPATVNWVRYRPAIGKDSPLFHDPLWSGNVSYQHIFDLQSGASVTAKVSVHFESSAQEAPNYFLDGIQKAFHQSDASLTYDTPDGKWELSAWVKNIENAAVKIDAESTGTGTDYVYPVYDAPRTWGVNLTAKF